jgi:hypothetical protein
MICRFQIIRLLCGKKLKKNYGGEEFSRKIGQKSWVEKINCELIIGEVSVRLTYLISSSRGFDLLLILSWTLDNVCHIRILDHSLISAIKNIR